MATPIQHTLDTFDPATAGAYNPGHVVVFFDHRGVKSSKDQMGYLQNYWLSTKYRLGWPSVWWTTDLEPGKLRLIWYTVCFSVFVPVHEREAEWARGLGGDEC